VLSEIDYPPGWRATIDGRLVAIERVNHVLRGLWVPPGDHDVRMVAVSPALAAGVTASRVSAALVLALFAWSWIAGRRRRARGGGSGAGGGAVSGTGGGGETPA